MRLIPAPFALTMTFILNGPCQHFGTVYCHIGLSFYYHCIPHSVWSLILSFGYRFYVLHQPSVPRNKLLVVMLIIYIPSLVQGLTYWMNFASREEILPFFQEYYPHYNFTIETGVITGVLDMTTISSAFSIIHMVFPITPVYIIIFILRRRIIVFLAKMAECMSKETRAAHGQLLKVLTVQAILPMFSWIAGLEYVLAQLGILNHPIIEYTICCLLLISPSVSPLVYLIYIKPYRDYYTRFSKMLTFSSVCSLDKLFRTWLKVCFDEAQPTRRLSAYVLTTV